VDFDFSQIAVPFRMQPGLRRLARGEPQLTPLVPGSALYLEKQRILACGASRLAVPGFEAGPSLQAIADEGFRQGCTPATGTPVELAWEEDFAVLDGATGTLPWLCVCVPSHWAPEEKLGLDFAAVHGPVADSAVLLAASRQLVRLATGGERWERTVWTISPSGRYDQHPHRHPRTPWPQTSDPHAVAAGCFFRAERQTFFPVGRGTQQALFTIRVMVAPLADAVAAPADAAALHAAISSMSTAVLAYKGLAPAKGALLDWLAGRAR
jgi:hypothetical protein